MIQKVIGHVVRSRHASDELGELFDEFKQELRGRFIGYVTVFGDQSWRELDVGLSRVAHFGSARASTAPS